MIHDLTPDVVAETARRMGVESLSADREYGLSLALGSAEVTPLEMASSYAVFANHGRLAGATPVVRVTDATGKVLEEEAANLQRLMDETGAPAWPPDPASDGPSKVLPR